MNIIILTRCYKPDNIQAIKDNLKEVFADQTEHTYVQYLVVDMSYDQKLQTFNQFIDEHTRTFFVYNKRDHYNNWGIDQLIKRLEGDQNTWVYVMDDDNLINKNFLKVFDGYKDEDVLVVNSNHFKYAVPLPPNRIVGYIDTSSYIVKLRVRKEVPVYIEGQNSYSADGKFFQILVKKQYLIKYTYINALTKSALSRPLNVLRKDL